jgi:hypothetical protein
MDVPYHAYFDFLLLKDGCGVIEHTEREVEDCESMYMCMYVSATRISCAHRLTSQLDMFKTTCWRSSDSKDYCETPPSIGSVLLWIFI